MSDSAESETIYISTFERLVSEEPPRALWYFIKIQTNLPPDRRLHCCLFLKEAGHVELADEAMDALLQHDGSSPGVWYESAIIRDMLGQSHSALSRLNRALALKPDFGPAAALRIATLIKLGERDRARELLAESAPPLLHRGQHVVLQAFNNSFDYWHGLLQGLESDRPLEDFVTVGAAIEKALDENLAYSMVRFGDGEGAFLVPEDNEDMRAIGDIACRFFARRWYGRGDDATLTAVKTVAAQLKTISPSFNIIGAPNDDWCRHEWNLGSFQTLACCLSARYFAARQPAMLSQTSVGLDLAHSGVLARLIRKAPSVCIVTCHSDLAPRLAAATGENKFDTLLIPPADSDLGITNLTPGNHLDDAARIMDAIDAAQGNRLFLIGGGFLGKLYTHRAAQGGAVAVDVGSVLDGIMDYSTRPNFYHISLAQRFWSALKTPV
ncbi:hypothetical protein ABI_20300 [Asticcacaulis biprosthecium C19]|uniref:GT-D fold-like domain-containing protein n=1 Tax=Asticcacaulis biprosthecium C19 TaxID=715226 RepID=F4QM17_9CAUL|nr:tetratricopeptide repeat protein [Asticcacaulis biprosthecium]EGF93589.1 hypothetical protein ABI_20300 [Asticcacaulis biprosthecium C19]